MLSSLFFILTSLGLASAQSLYYVAAFAKETIPVKWSIGENVIFDSNVVSHTTDQIGDFSYYQPKQVTVLRNPLNSFDSFPLAMDHPAINEEIDWNAHSYSSSFNITSSYPVYLSVISLWSNPPRKPTATILQIPEIPWITGKEQVVKIPIETDGEIFSQTNTAESPIRQEICQEWVTDVTKLNLGGEEYDVYADVIPSENMFSDVSVDAQRHVYTCVFDRFSNQPLYYYRIDTHGLGTYVSHADMPPVITHRIPGRITEKTQRLISTQLILHVSANAKQQIRTFNIRLYKTPLSASNAESATASSVYQLGDVEPHDVAIDQIGDILPHEGNIAEWDASMAGNYTGTLIEGSDAIRAPIGKGILQSCTFSKDGSYSGVMQIRGQRPLRIRGKMSSSNPTSVSAETIKRKATQRGCRLAFMRLADNSIVLIARCYFGNGDDYYCLAEKSAMIPNGISSLHTLAMPIEDQNGAIANATGRMTISKTAKSQIIWRLPNGKTLTSTSRVTERGMIPIFIDGDKNSIVGRLRFTPGHELGDWIGGLHYRTQRSKNDFYDYVGTCVGDSFNGWNATSRLVTIHIEYTNNQTSRIAANYNQNNVTAEGVVLRLASNGSITGTIKLATGRAIKLTGVALSSQHIWTCSSNLAEVKKITVTGVSAK